MTWIKVSDDFWRHQKVRRLLDRPLGPAALGLWVAAQSWIGEELSDGYVPARQPTRLMGADVPELVEELVLAGLWERSVGGWTVHDYLDYNPSRAQVVEERERRHQLASEGGQARAKEGRRDGSGRFASSGTAGDAPSRTAGSAAGKSPAVSPAGEPAPSPVPRTPFSRVHENVDEIPRKPPDVRRANGPMNPVETT